MASPLPPLIQKSYTRALQWFEQTPSRALDQAYNWALAIKALEDEFFDGQIVDGNGSRHSRSVGSYLVAERDKYLNLVRLKLIEFRVSRAVLEVSAQITRHHPSHNPYPEDVANIAANTAANTAANILEKLKCIDDITEKYLVPVNPNPEVSEHRNVVPNAQVGTLVPVAKSKSSGQSPGNGVQSPRRYLKQVNPNSLFLRTPPSGSDDGEKNEGMMDNTGVLPRSILRTFERIRQELRPDAEEQAVKNFRTSKTKTIVSIYFIFLLILVPLLTQELSKHVLVGPIVDHLRGAEVEIDTFLSKDIETETLSAFERFENEFKLKRILTTGALVSPSDEEMGQMFQEKIKEVAQDQWKTQSNAIKNIFADLLAFIAFCGVFWWRKEEVTLLKSFMDDVVYGLSDSAKAFIIILFTDVFVGFHSPHGWEVILEGISRHLGLPESRQFIFLFIATFPVILDTVFKYWIFRYLNRISPSAVATYRNMNE